MQEGVPLVALHTTPQALQFWTVFVGPQPPSPPASGAVTHAPFWQSVLPVHAAWLCQIPVPSQTWGVEPTHCAELGTHVPEQVPWPVQA